MYGSVAERVLSNAPCPVLMMRTEKPLKHVLIPLDGSELAERVVPFGLTLATRLGCSVTLLQVIPTVGLLSQSEGHITYHFYGAGAAQKRPPQFQHQTESLMLEEARAYLNHILAPYTHLNLPAQTVAEAGPAAETILAFAETHLVDCIAMATHGRSGFLKWVYGSVTEKVLRGSRVSMFIVRSTQP
jgi:nucleotide-binding universal stress UspA family protein